jgi:hypothetical protein
MDLSPDVLFRIDSALQKIPVVVATPNDTSYRIVEKLLWDIPALEPIWMTEIIDALAEIFMHRPPVLIVFYDTNQETLDFIKLVRNNPAMKDMTIFAVFTEPLRWRHKVQGGGLEKFETPLNSSGFLERLKEVLVERLKTAPTR